jgi:phosphopantothenoylcysteine synthetase/decarboxylase
MPRPLLLVGGAPRLAVDAVRHLTVAATGSTACDLARRLAASTLAADLLLSVDAGPGVPAMRYADRDGLETALAAWIAAHRDGVVVMSAAVNDYTVATVERHVDGRIEVLPPGAKLPSGADAVVIRLRPAGKLIDRLRPDFGLNGPIVGFKHEDAATVEASAEALRRRVGAALVVANSLCGGVQTLVDADGRVRHADRPALLADLTRRLVALAG